MKPRAPDATLGAYVMVLFALLALELPARRRAEGDRGSEPPGPRQAPAGPDGP